MKKLIVRYDNKRIHTSIKISDISTSNILSSISLLRLNMCSNSYLYFGPDHHEAVIII